MLACIYLLISAPNCGYVTCCLRFLLLLYFCHSDLDAEETLPPEAAFFKITTAIRNSTRNCVIKLTVLWVVSNHLPSPISRVHAFSQFILVPSSYLSYSSAAMVWGNGVCYPFNGAATHTHSTGIKCIPIEAFKFSLIIFPYNSIKEPTCTLLLFLKLFV